MYGRHLLKQYFKINSCYFPKISVVVQLSHLVGISPKSYAGGKTHLINLLMTVSASAIYVLGSVLVSVSQFETTVIFR